MGRATDTRILLIETAERLLAERGLNGVSLRDIAAAAGQRNTRAVQYHFQSKAGLIDAVFLHRMEPINEERVALLEELDASGRGSDLRSLAEAFLLPLSSALGDVGHPSWYLRFSFQAGFLEGTVAQNIGRHPWTYGMHAVQTRFGEALNDAGIPARLRDERWGLFSGHMAHALADRELLLQYHPQLVRSDRSLFLSDLLDTAVALAVAPVSTDTARLLGYRRSA